MMKAYFLATNGNNSVILTDGITAKIFDGAPSGYYEGVDLYRTNADNCLDEPAILGDLAGRFASLERNGDLSDYSDIYSTREVEYEDLQDELENAIMFYTSERVKVFYGGGESRYNPGMAVDYMIAELHGVELYAELSANERDDYTNFWDLRVEIIMQAVTNGFSPVELEFPL